MTSIALPRLLSTRISVSKDDTSRSTRTVSLNDDQQQIQQVQQKEDHCMAEINGFFRNFGVRLPHEKVFRYACFHDFDSEEAIERIREDDYSPYLQLKMKDLEEDFETNTIFPIPRLRTHNNSEVVYMRPNRFFNSSNKCCDKFVESLCYVLNDLSRTEEQCRNGVTVVADMQDISKENFSKESCKKLLSALQGEMVPTRVEAFVIVSPPTWFSNIWKWMKPTVSKDFARRVHLIKEERLSEFLMGDYKRYLPDDFCLGLARASELAEDYVDLKMFQEQ